MLNKFRVGNIDAEVESILKSRFILKDHPNYPVMQCTYGLRMPLHLYTIMKD